MNCYFCATGKLGFKANLTSAQIINQILSIPPAPGKGEEPMNPLTNVVFMGMGEPLDNFKEVDASTSTIWTKRTSAEMLPSHRRQRSGMRRKITKGMFWRTGKISAAVI